MSQVARKVPTAESPGDISGLHLAGGRYWTASLLPALVGTTLPFWLRPPGFSFRWSGAVEFLFATVLFHAGFSFLQARFEGRSTARWPHARLLGHGCACIVLACVLGLHINAGLWLGPHVHGHIFIAFGIAAVFAGLLYVAPPVRFSRRMGGEVVVALGLGMMPVLGAYLVQAGDLTRTVYLASLPLVVATGLWVWIDELISRPEDEKTGRRTLVVDFGPRFSGRVGVPALAALLVATVLVAMFSKSTSAWAVTALLGSGLTWRIVVVCRRGYSRPAAMIGARRDAFVLHLVTGGAVATSSLLTVLA